MAVFLNNLYQDKATKITYDDKYVTDKIGSFKTSYTNQISNITLVLSPLTLAEKNSVLAHYAANFTESVDLIVNAYDTGTIPVFYTSPPKVASKGRVHFKVTCGFRG